jgi:8-oxo-dGTP pyrophosphatase MutT (NUDIX family)
MKHPRWGDFTFIGGHEEPEDHQQLDITARRETLEELGLPEGRIEFQLFPLTDEITFGPIWSKSTHCVKSYIFKYYGVKFHSDPHIRYGYNEAGSFIKLFSVGELQSQNAISNVVRVFLDRYAKGLDSVPLSWTENCGSPDAS